MKGLEATSRGALVIAVAMAVVGCGSVAAGSDAGATGSGGGPGGGSVGGPGGDCNSNVGSSTLLAGPPPTQNNSADLQGVVLGGLAFDTSTMRRMIPITMGTPIAGLQVGPAYLTRSDTATETAYLTIAVTNTGTQRPCFIKASPLSYLNGSQVLNDPTHAGYVSGSVGDVGFGIFTDTCLGPGESGYIIDIQLDSSGTAFFSSTTSIALSLASSSAGTVPGGHLHPTGYEVGSCAPMRSLRLTTVNDGTAAVEVAQSTPALSPVILLDGGGLPAGWLYLQDNVASQVAVGEMVSLDAMVTAVWAVDRARFFIQFDGAAAAALELGPTPAALAASAADARSAREALLARWLSAVAR